MNDRALAVLALSGMLCFGASMAGEVEVIDALFDRQGETWNVSVTLRHDDTGWDHYADAYRVVDGEGTVLGTRILHHPHVDEQPFTRSLNGVRIPARVDVVYVQGRDNVHGWGSQRMAIELRR